MCEEQRPKIKQDKEKKNSIVSEAWHYSSSDGLILIRR